MTSPQFFQNVLGDFLVARQEHLACFGIGKVSGRQSPDQFFIGNRDFFDAGFTDTAQEDLGELSAFLDDGFFSFLIHNINGRLDADMNVGIQFPEEFPLLDVDLLHRIVHAIEIFGRIPECLQKDRHRHFPPAINSDVQDISRIELKIKPGTPIGNDPCREKNFSAGVGPSLIMGKGHTRRSVQLTHDNALGSIDDERPRFGHQRQFTHINFGLFALADLF